MFGGSFGPAQVSDKVDPRNDDSAPPWIIRQCRSDGEFPGRVGGSFVFKIPAGAEHLRESKSGGLVDRIRYPNSNDWLTVASSGYSYPTDDEMATLKQVHRRPIKIIDDVYPSRGSDYRGVTKDGKFWRWTGGWDNAEYKASSSKAARYFDRIIDSAYFRPVLTD
jgi:hypothetical protein